MGASTYDAMELTWETMANSNCRGRFGLHRKAVLNEAYDQPHEQGW